MPSRQSGKENIAIIGMSGRFPGASTISEFWDNLCQGKESIEYFSREELLEEGIPEHMVDHASYVAAKPRLKDVDQFDPLFFSISPDDAMLMDPQHRLILEESWKALEDAGYPPSAQRRDVGVYMSNYSTSYPAAVYDTLSDIDSGQSFRRMVNNDRDYLSTRVAYKFNFSGPALTIQTACSSSLVSVHLCSEALRHNQCSLGLVGGVALTFPNKAGYFYKEGLVFSKDGHCRPFSDKANGTVFGEGVGVVVLKRFDDAIADGDKIYAVIKGGAINNDGSEKRDLRRRDFLVRRRFCNEHWTMHRFQPNRLDTWRPMLPVPNSATLLNFQHWRRSLVEAPIRHNIAPWDQ